MQATRGTARGSGERPRDAWLHQELTAELLVKSTASNSRAQGGKLLDEGWQPSVL